MPGVWIDPGLQADVFLPLRSWYYDPGTGLAVTRNYGALGGTARLGDGATVGTFPTFVLPRKAVKFNGANQFFSLGTAVGNYTDNFSAFALIAPTAASIVGGARVFSRRNLGAGLIQWELMIWPNGQPAFIDSGGGTLFGAWDWRYFTFGTIGVTMNAGSVQLYSNGQPDGASGARVLVAQPAVETCIGDLMGGAIAPFGGELGSPMLFPFALSAAQIASLHARTMRELNKP